MDRAGYGETATLVDEYIQLLATAGLVQLWGNTIYQMHPALREYLNQNCSAGDKLKQVFVGTMAVMAHAFAPKELHEQKGFFHIHGANCRNAVSIAEGIGMEGGLLALVQALASYALNAGNYTEGENLYRKLSMESKKQGNQELEKNKPLPTTSWA